jgi:hypothetical protein
MLTTHLVFPDHWKTWANHGKKSCVYEEACGSKEVNLRRPKQPLSCQITGYLTEIPSQVTCHAMPWKYERSWKYCFFTSGDTVDLSKPKCLQGKSVNLPVFEFWRKWLFCILKTNCGRWLFEDRLTKDCKTTVVVPKLFFSGKILSPKIMWWDKTSG